MTDWVRSSVFYHIYPLGFCGAPDRNDFQAPPTARLGKVAEWLPHLKQLGVNALYLGPLFESMAHGYDTVDYFIVDRRLGTNETLAQLVETLHQNGVRVILDGVFHHVGREFRAFQEVRKHGAQSEYCRWFAGLSFDRHSPCGDPFTYEAWDGHYDLVKLNLRHPPVREYLFRAVEKWVREFKIDGLRLDAADKVDKEFLKVLSGFCKGLNPDFWLMGEVVFGDYRGWVNERALDSVTNYETYKGLYSSHVDGNYFEIAYALNRQFGAEGIYREMPLYTFADNHDVDRVASRLSNPAHLCPLYCLLFTIPGVPSIYYGSEWGLTGQKCNGSDAPLRPALDLAAMASRSPQPALPETIARLSAIRLSSPALQAGSYHQLHVSHQQLAFARQTATEYVVVVVNSSDQPASLTLTVPDSCGQRLEDRLNPPESFEINHGSVQISAIPPRWARILVARS
jgi:glycosidase